MQFQKCKKKHYLHFQNWQKNNFAPEKSLKLPKILGFFFQSKNCIFGSFILFSGTKIIFLPILKMQIMFIFSLLKLHFFPILEHCALSWKSWKIPKMQFSDFFLVQKLIFCHIWNCKKCVFVLLILHFFSNFIALCSGQRKFLKNPG